MISSLGSFLSHNSNVLDLFLSRSFESIIFILTHFCKLPISKAICPGYVDRMLREHNANKVNNDIFTFYQQKSIRPLPDKI